MIENNKAVVTRINVQPHPNADRLQLGYCFGNQLIVGLDTHDGDLGVFFPTETQISKEFAVANDLIRRKDENGKIAGGMFDDNRKVRCQKFRGEKSEGFFAPLSYFHTLGIDTSKFKEGDCFDSLNGIPICKKFYSQKTRNAISGNKKEKKRGETEFFKCHFDTPQFRMNLKEFKKGDLITISSKLHGCAHKGTLISTLESGDLTLGEIVNQRLKVKVKAYDHDIDEIVYTDIDEYFFRENDGEWYEIELEDGRTIKITSNNPVYLPELKTYRQVKDLRIGDELLIS